MSTNNVSGLSPPPSLDQIARRVRDRSERMLEHDADKVRLAMANGDDLIDGRDRFTEHGSWLPFVREACELKQRQALNYVKLAQHRTLVEQYLHSCAILERQASIIGALKFVSPSDVKPKRPKKLSEIEAPAVLGAFLEQRPDLLFEALAYAPGLKVKIQKRLERPLGHKAAKARAKAARELTQPPLVARDDTASLH